MQSTSACSCFSFSWTQTIDPASWTATSRHHNARRSHKYLRRRRILSHHHVHAPDTWNLSSSLGSEQTNICRLEVWFDCTQPCCLGLPGGRFQSFGGPCVSACRARQHVRSRLRAWLSQDDQIDEVAELWRLLMVDCSLSEVWPRHSNTSNEMKREEYFSDSVFEIHPGRRKSNY